MINDKTFVTAIVIALVFAALILSVDEPEQVEQPKQLPYVVFFEVCDAMQGAVLTTDPLQWVDFSTEGTPEVLDAMNEAEATGRSYLFTGLDKDNCQPVIY